MIKGFGFKPHSSEILVNAMGKALFAAREQILTDCNYFVKVDQGILRDSAYTTMTGPMTLACVWDTPYAKRQYYTGTPSTDVNVNASLEWAQKAADTYKDDWRRILEKGLGENL